MADYGFIISVTSISLLAILGVSMSVWRLTKRYPNCKHDVLLLTKRNAKRGVLRGICKACGVYADRSQG